MATTITEAAASSSVDSQQHSNKPDKPIRKFADFRLSARTLKGLSGANFVKPTDIQRLAIPPALSGSDIVASAKTGSGKTLAFVVPALELLHRERWSRDLGLGALIVSPTRELAYQIFRELRRVGAKQQFSLGLVTGGYHDVKEQGSRVGKMNILVATPGRLVQHLSERPDLSTDNLRLLVLDEADRILHLGFKAELDALLDYLPAERQTLLFSATQTRSVQDLVRLKMRQPVCQVDASKLAATATPDGLRQGFVRCQSVCDKPRYLWQFITGNRQRKSIVFFATCKQVRFYNELFLKLRPGVRILQLHGGMTQRRRTAVYDEFVRVKHAVLLCTDLASRGLDFPDVDCVLQVDCPPDLRTYVHRVGRTARLSRTGRAVVLLLDWEADTLPSLLAGLRPPVHLEPVKLRLPVKWDIVAKLAGLVAADCELRGVAERAIRTYLKTYACFAELKQVVTLCSWLRRAFRKSKSTTTATASSSINEAEDRRLEICLDNYSAVPADEDAELHEAPIDAELRRDGRLQADDDNDDDDDDDNVEVDADVEGFRLTDEIGDEPTKRQLGSSGPVHVVGLYSLMPPERQAAAFREPPDGYRMIVVATNVAETSITIPCVRYVVDTGRVKTKVYDKVTGVSTFVVTWTSKASAEQRAGRAGRLGPGHCYRLYSSQVYTDSFKDFAEPELLTKPVDEVVLLAKLYVNDVLHFPFPNAPDGEAVAASEARLVKLGALDSRKRLTPQGALMRQFPVAARFAKMLVVCEQQEELIPYVILLVACLSVPEIFMEESAASSVGDGDRGNDDSSVERKQRAKAFRRSFARTGQALLLGDPMSLIGVAAWYERQLGQRGRTEAELVEQLGQLGVRHRAIGEVRKLRRHLTDIAGRLFVRRQVFLDPAMPPPPERVSLQMRRLLASVMPDQVASKIPDKPRAYRCRSLAGDLYIHPSSVLARELPPTVLFQEVHESSKMFMRCVCAIDESWLSTAEDNRA